MPKKLTKLPGIAPSSGVPIVLPHFGEVLASATPKTGHHLRTQVANGTFRIRKNVREQTEAFKECERKLLTNTNVTLPWNLPSKSRHTPGSVSKMIYISLLDEYMRGVICPQYDLTASPLGGDGKAFYRISRFYVFPDTRKEFDAGTFPTIASLSDPAVKTRRKTLTKQWETAGFEQYAMADGGVWFIFSPEVYAKQKVQQCKYRRIK